MPRKDKQAAIRQSVRRALLTVAPSEAQDAVEEAVAEMLGEEIVIPAITELAKDLIGGQIVNRSQMYPDALWATYENNVAAREFDEGVTLGRRLTEEDGDVCDDCAAASTEEFVPLDELPEIGDSVCGSRCRCQFEFQVEGQQFRTSDLFSAVIGGQDQYGGSVEIQ